MALVLTGTVLSVQPYERGNQKVLVQSSSRFNDEAILGPDIQVEVGKQISAPVRASIDRDPQTGAVSVSLWGAGYVRKPREQRPAAAHV